ncbi:hypothetical protein BLNAU_16674 [Blattamonas nauphoetae]|uniref:Protein kinase domain-containing protein n=1 Tax=Blattamonas nauphoetae TaxID=2049346 RepID=A0ABQ9XAK2_9EUKA|nr:hypothetical protein BLNAU_16674 [Blattamonas nauphoetae]
MTNCVLEGVVDGLDGTVTAPLSACHSFLCQNSSFSQIINSAQHEHNTSNFTHVGQTYNADVVSERFSVTHQAAPVMFIGCTITSTNPPKSFIFISMTNHSEDLTISNCTFRVTTTSSIYVRVVYFQTALGSFPTLTVDKLKSEYSATDTSPNTQSVISVARSATAHITGSNFTSQVGSSSRPLQFKGGTFILHIFGCVFSDAMTTGGGGVITINSGGELIMSDCLMERNQATGNGGCVSVGRQCITFHRCMMKNNRATRGGVLTSSGLTLGVWEDCAFEANVATEGQHFSGNDLVNNAGFSTYNSELIIGCTSTSASPKISYYSSATSNGFHPQEDILLPHPSTKSDYDQLMAVDLDGSGTTCSEEVPCQTLASAFAKISSTGRNKILVRTGAFSDSARTLSGSMELVGNGWIRDSSFFTTLTTAGMKVGGGGNVTLRSMTLLPSTDTTVVASMDEEGTLRFSFIRIDLLLSHLNSLVSISKGTTMLFRCWFNQVNLANSAFVFVSGSASLNVHGTYFMLIRRESGDGASCIDSESTGAISFETSDFGNCSSSGKAGVLHLKGKDGQGSISFRTTYFYNNIAKQSSLATDGSLIFAHDIILDGIATEQISTTALQSISPQISFLRLGVPDRLSPIANFGYSADGITFPLAGKYYQAVPISQFSSIKKMTEETFKYCTSVSPIMSGCTLPLDPLLAEDVVVKWRFGARQPSTSAETLVTVGQNATFYFSEGSITFDECPTCVQFVVLHSTGMFSLRFETLKFTCETTHIYVPLFSVSNGQLEIETCEIQTGLSFLDCSMVEATDGSILLKNTAFTQITTTGNGSVVHSTSTTVNIDSCSFEECSAKNGGVVWFEASGSHFLQVLHPPTSAFSTTFLNCGASEKGGALCVEGTTSLPNPIRFSTTTVNHARFSGSWSGSVGKDVYVGKSVFGSKPTSAILKFGGGSYSDWHHVEIEGRGADENELKDIGFLIPLPIVSVNGSVNETTTGLSGKDDEACKWTSTFCATLGFGIDILKSKYNGENIEMGVQYVWNMTYTENPMVVSDQSVVLTGTTATNQNKCDIHRTIVKMNDLSTTGSPLFTITNKAIFSVSNIDFFIKPENGLFTMDAAGDTLKIENSGMIASSGSVSSKSVVSVAGGSVWMKDISLNTSATGRSTFSSPLLHLHSEAGPIILQSISCSNIAISDSSSIVSFVTQFAVVMTDVTFDDCLVSSDESHLVFLEGTDFINQIIPSCWEGSFSSSTPLMDFWGKDSSLSSGDWKESSLMFYLFPPETVIVLNRDATNPSHHPNCGSALLSCQSLNSAFSSLRDTIRAVSIESEADLTEKIVVTSSCSFIASSSVQILKMAEAGSTEVNGPGVTLSINKLEIKCLSSSSVSSLFSVVSGTLEMEGCVIGSSSSLSPLSLPSSVASLIEIGSSGTVSFVASSVSHSAFTHASKGSSLIVQKGGSITLDTSSSISNVLSGGIGSHVLVFGDSFPSIAESEVMQRLKPTPPSSGYFSSEERNRLAGCVDGAVDGILFEWYPVHVGEQHVQTEGVDHLKGGHSALPQLTVNFAISRLGGDGSIILDSSLSFEETVTFPDLTIEITSNRVQNTRKEISVGSGGHFSVEHGHLTLSSLSFSTTIAASSFIVLSNSGSLSISACSFDGFSSPSSGSVLSASLGSTNTLSIVDTEFSDCNSEMDGGVIALTLSQSTKSSQIEIKASFSRCSCGDSKKGGWVFVAGHNLASQILPSNWEGHPTTFGDENENTLWGTDSKGDWVFLDGFCFGDLISAPNWLSVCSGLTSPENDSLLFGVDHKEPTNSSFHLLSLLYYLLPFRSSTIFAGSSGRDSNGCGQEARKCRRLETAHSHLSGTADFDLFVVGSASLTTLLVFAPNDLQLRPKSGRETIHVEEEGRFEDGNMAENHMLSVHRISFNLDTAKCSALFKTGVGQLVLTSCSFEKADGFDLEIVNLIGGEVSIDNTTFSSASFNRTPFVFSSFTHVEFAKVRFESCSGELFVEASGSGENSKMSFDSCHFSGNMDTIQLNTNSDEICTWSTGLVRLTNTSTTFRSVDFADGRGGGIRQEGGWSNLTNTTFSNFSPSHPLFPSARRNLFCSANGTVVVHVDNSEGKDLWIGGTNCSIKNGTETLLSPFFVPTLDSSQSKSEQNKKKQTFSLLISGTMLIPCGLSLEIFEEKGSTSDPSTVPLLLSESTTTSFNETTITLEVSLSSLEKALNSSLEWSGRLMFGVGMRTAEKFRVKVSRAEERKSQAKQAVSIIVPIAASLLVMLFLLLLILLLIRRHRKKTKESLASQKELDHIEQDGDGIKMDVFGDDMHEKWTGDIIKPDASTRSGIETFNDETVRDASEPSERSCRSDRNGVGGRMVEAMKCDGEFATSVVARTDTLFDRLHSESKKEMNKRVILVELTKALQKMRISLPDAEALTHLSSHWVMFDIDGQMLLQVKREKNKIVQPHHSHHSLQRPILHPPQQVGSLHSSSHLNNSSPHLTQNQPRESFFRLANESDVMSIDLSATQTNDNSAQTSTSSDEQEAHFENIALRHGFTQPVTQPDFEMATPQSNPRTDTAFEGLRWQAPEVVGSRVEVDREKAAVFSLGLIMWEVETEMVPFGEMDAVNAARQNETGCLPRMNLISDLKERELIQQCLQTDPSSRPSLSSLLSALSELPLTSSVDRKNDPHIS